MTSTKEAAALVKAVAVVVREYIGLAVADVQARVKAIEDRPVPRDGKDGERGADGQKGADGEQGPPGRTGPEGKSCPAAAGERGEPGPPGKDGDRGIQGERGPEGPAGPARDGRDGLPGVPGAQGEKGLDGTNGLHGKDGADGLGFGDLSVEHDGERTFTIKAIHGEHTKSLGSFTLPIPIWRKQFVDGRKYQPGDVVRYARSAWICEKETTISPSHVTRADGLAAGPQGEDFWSPFVEKGRDGRDGVDAPGALPVVAVGRRP